MGLVDNVKKVYNAANKKIKAETGKSQIAEEKAANWNIERICREYSRESNYFSKTGYFTALRRKCDNASDREIIDIFEYAYNRDDKDVLNPMTAVMLKMGLLVKDDDGKVHKNY